MIREARPDEAEALAGIQRDASLAALAHIFPPQLYPFPVDEVRERNRALERLCKRALARCHLWVLEDHDRARRFYERHGWRENGRSRVVPFPPNPLDVGYTIDLESRMAGR